MDGAEVDLQPLLDVGGDGRLGAPRAAVPVVVKSGKMINKNFGFSKKPNLNLLLCPTLSYVDYIN